MSNTSKALTRFNLFLVLTAAIFSSCGSNDHAEESNTSTDSVAVVDTSSEIETEQVTYILPSPLQIASIFKKSGLSYIEGVTNKESNLSKYSSKHSKAVNMGVYSADLAYCVLNKQTQHSLNYMKTVKQVAEQLGLGSTFENSLLQRFEKNMSNEDSLAYIVAELQMQTDMHLEENDQKQMSPVMFAGAWVESMYIASKVNEKNKNKNIANKLSEQMLILDKIINALKAHQNEEGISQLITDLEKVHSTYTNSSSVKKSASEEEEEETINLSEEDIKALTSQITELRNKITNG